MPPKKLPFTSPSDFVYLDNPIEKNQEKFNLQSPFESISPITPYLRDISNIGPSRVLSFDPETTARVAQEEKIMRLRQEKKRMQALRAMQIAEVRRRRMQRTEVENIEEDLTKMNIKEPPKISAEKIFKDPTKKFFKNETRTLKSSTIIRYTLEELKNLRPKPY